MTYAQPSDVSARLGRPLTTDETTQVAALLGDAEILIKSRIPDLDDKVAAGSPTESTVIMVEASAVARLVRNPDGYTAEGDGSYSYQINWRLSTGQLEISDREWSLLGYSAGVFAVDVRPRTPFERAAAEVPAGVHPFMLGWSPYVDPGWSHPIGPYGYERAA